MESVLFHGSSKIIERPVLSGGKVHNDFGQGFYCTPDIQLAREWACTKGQSSFVSHYSFIPQYFLKVCDLTGPGYNVLNWLAILMANRIFQTENELPLAIKNYIIEEFLPDLSQFDVIRGYRADDSYFRIAEGFISGSISLARLSEALRLGKLGEQVFLKSQKAFDALMFLSFEEVDRSIYGQRRRDRDTFARDEFRKLSRMDSEKDAVLAIDIYRQRWRNDDVRLR